MQKTPHRLKPTISGLPKLISADELSVMLGMSKRTVWRLLSAGQLPQPVRIGRNTRWRLEEVRQWIDAGCPVLDNSTN